MPESRQKIIVWNPVDFFTFVSDINSENKLTSVKLEINRPATIKEETITIPLTGEAANLNIHYPDKFNIKGTINLIPLSPPRNGVGVMVDFMYFYSNEPENRLEGIIAEISLDSENQPVPPAPPEE